MAPAMDPPINKSVIRYIWPIFKGRGRLRKSSQAFALAVPNDKVLAIRDDVGFFQSVRARIIKSSPEHELPWKPWIVLHKFVDLFPAIH